MKRSTNPCAPAERKPPVWPAILALLSGLAILATGIVPICILWPPDVKAFLKFLLAGDSFWPGGLAGWLMLIWLMLLQLTGVGLVTCGTVHSLRWRRRNH